MLKRFNMQDCNPISTPINVHLSNQMSPKTNEEGMEIKRKYHINKQLLVWCLQLRQQVLMYVCFAVSKLSKFNNNPGKEHWPAVKRVIRYLKGTKSTNLTVKEDSQEPFVVISDSDWTSDINEHCPVTGQLLFFRMELSLDLQSFKPLFSCRQLKLNIWHYLHPLKKCRGFEIWKGNLI